MDDKIRVIVAKPGLDGHDRGAKVIARAFRDAGFEVIYTGLRQTPEQIAHAAVAEDVSLVGLSILAGGHLGLTRKVVEQLRALDAAWIQVVVGGVIPEDDVPLLKEAGASAVFPSSTSIDAVVESICQLVGEGSPAH